MMLNINVNVVVYLNVSNQVNRQKIFYLLSRNLYILNIKTLKYLGMRKDNILTPEEKLSKQQRLEANRRIRLTQISNNADNTNSKITAESPSIYTRCEPVSENNVYNRLSKTRGYFFLDNWHAINSIISSY